MAATVTYGQQAHLAIVVDPCLRQELGDFFSECYVPARSKYQADRPATTAVDTLRPTKPVPGWSYDPSRDTEYDPATPPDWGRPTCKQWWQDGSTGLRQKLVDGAPVAYSRREASGD